MVGNAETSGERSAAQVIEVTEQVARKQDAGTSRSWLFSFGRARKIVPSRLEAGADTRIGTESPAEHAKLIPSHSHEDIELPVQGRNDSRPSADQNVYLMREPWRISAVVVEDEKKDSQPADGSGDRNKMDLQGAADSVDASLHHPAIYAARALYKDRPKPDSPDQILTDARGDGDDEPPDGTDRFQEASDPDHPLNRVKRELSDRLQEHGITPGTPSFHIINQWATHETYSSLREKVSNEQKEAPNEHLVQALESIFQDSLQNIHTLAEANPGVFEDATNLFSELLPHYEQAVSENHNHTDHKAKDALNALDHRMQAASLMGVHMDEIEQESIVFAEPPKQNVEEEAQEATSETLAELKQRLTKLVHATKLDSPKLSYLRKYAAFFMEKNKVYEQFLVGNIKQREYTDTFFELSKAFDSETIEDVRHLAEFNAVTITVFYDAGIFALYKDAMKRQKGELNHQSMDSIREEAIIEVETATQIYKDLEEIISQNRSEDQEQRDHDENPYARAQEKLVGEFLGGDWIETPLLSEILRLQLRMAQAEIPGIRAIIAQEERKMTRASAQVPIVKSLEEPNKLQEQFIADAGDKWITQRGMHPYDFYAAIWEGEEVYQAYVDAAMKDNPPVDRNMAATAQNRINAISMFRRDVTPLILTQNIVKIRGYIWDAFRFPRY